jgi:DNA replication protein DnaC
VSELVTSRIRATAGKLGLPHLAETLAGHLERAGTAQMGYLDFLDLILEEELAVREERRLRHALKASKMPHHKTVDDYDFSYQPELDPRKIRDLASLAFVEAKANAALLGPPGVGKTHLAVALAVAACRAGYSVYFTTLDDMVRQLKAADAIGRLASKLRTYLRPHVLVLDEVGYLPLARDEANLVFQMISKRYEKGAIVLTSNKAFSEWGSVFGDEVLATAILRPPPAPLRGHRHQRPQLPAQEPPRRRRRHRQDRDSLTARGPPVTATSPHSGDDTHDLIDDALYQLAERRSKWLGDPLAAITLIASLIDQAERMLPEHVLLALDDGASWHDIATALATSPEQAELRYSPDSPVADSRWPYDW